MGIGLSALSPDRDRMRISIFLEAAHVNAGTLLEWFP
jgi:hypothetical protein